MCIRIILPKVENCNIKLQGLSATSYVTEQPCVSACAWVERNLNNHQIRTRDLKYRTGACSKILRAENKICGMDAVKRKLYVHGIHGSDVGDQSRRIFRVKQAVIIDTRHVKESGRLARMHGNAIHLPRDSRSVYVCWRDSRSTVPPQWQTISRVKSSLSLVQTMPMHNSSGPQKHRSAVCLRFRR